VDYEGACPSPLSLCERAPEPTEVRPSVGSFSFLKKIKFKSEFKFQTKMHRQNKNFSIICIDCYFI
jgi:hypothetical protein